MPLLPWANPVHLKSVLFHMILAGRKVQVLDGARHLIWRLAMSLQAGTEYGVHAMMVPDE